MTTFFVGGSMRSGTTLLQAVLCSTKDTNPHIFEAQYLTRLFMLHHYGHVQFDGFLQHYFDDQAQMTAFHADMIQQFLDLTRRRYHPAPHLVLKNPEMTRLFPMIADLVEDSKFIISVRDPRDTIASILDVAQRQAAQGQTTNLTQTGRDMTKHAANFNQFYAPVFNEKNSDFMKSVFIVKYEELVVHTQAVLNSLSDFTGLALRDFDPEQPWRTLVDFSDDNVIRRPFHTSLRGRPISKDRIDRYVKSFSKDELQTIERVCGPFMNAFGYKPDS
jgi:hypothetical protein